MRRFLLAFASILPLAAVPAHAEEGGETPTAVQPVLVEGAQDDLGPVLTASRSVLAGEALARVRAASLGETLARTPGVQNSAFGPAAGRPEIRGQSGPRVALLINGMPSRDASTLSGDHAAPIEPFLADRIVVSKGSASVLNGGQAVGGAVDVIDGRIPTRVPDQAFSGRAEVSGGYNTGAAAMARLDGGRGEWAWHLDALYRDAPDLHIPSGSKDQACRTWKSLVSSTYVQTLCQVRLSSPTWVRDPATGLWVDGTPPERQVITDRNPGADGRLSNSGLTTKVVTLGGGRITADGYFGAAVQRYVSDYGVPGFAYITSSHPQPSPIGLQVRSTRFDVKGGLTPDALGVARIDFALARTEGDDREVIDGEAHTRLRTEADDLRIDVTHKPFAGFTGLVGVQASQRDLATDGAKAYLPSVATREDAIYWTEQFAWRALTVKAGARAGRTRYDVDEATIRPGRGLGSLAKDRDYSTTDLSGSLRYDVIEGLFVEARYDETERAPSLIELYANGDHFGILTEEQGDSRLKVERAKTTEFGAGFQRGRYRLTATAYRTDYDNYLYLGNTGVSRTLPVREWRQGDTRIEGLEIEGSVAFRGTAVGDIVLGGFVDRVRSTPRFTLPDGYSPFTSKVTTADWDKEYFRRNLDGDYLPRMPVSRFGGDVSWSRGVWSASLGAVRYEAQDRVAKNEAPTAAYTLVDAHAAYAFEARGAKWEAFVDATNLLDEEARAHNSFLRYRAPMAGRAARLGLRARF